MSRAVVGRRMRYVELTVRPGDRWFHEIDRHIAGEPSLRHGPVHHVDLLDDSTAVILYEIHGEREAVESLFDDHYEAIYHELVGDGDVTFVYSHFEPSPVVLALLETVRSHRILIDTPIRFTDDDQLRVGVVGDADTIQRVFTDVTVSAQVTVEATGEYQPSADRYFADLTGRQQEILLTALRMGYYETPRQTTYAEIAEQVDCTATTVGEHLRKIEGRILSAIAPAARV